MPFAVIGTTGGPKLSVKGLMDVEVETLSRAWRTGIANVLR